MMNPNAYEEFRGLLMQRRGALLQRLHDLRGGAAGRAQAAAEQFLPAEDNHAQLISHKDLAFALDAQELAQLQAIDEALARLATGRFGECIDCGAGIDSARLRALPQALRCAPCQQLWEQAQLRAARRRA